MIQRALPFEPRIASGAGSALTAFSPKIAPPERFCPTGPVRSLPKQPTSHYEIESNIKIPRTERSGELMRFGSDELEICGRPFGHNGLNLRPAQSCPVERTPPWRPTKMSSPLPESGSWTSASPISSGCWAARPWTVQSGSAGGYWLGGSRSAWT